MQTEHVHRHSTRVDHGTCLGLKVKATLCIFLVSSVPDSDGESPGSSPFMASGNKWIKRLPGKSTEKSEVENMSLGGGEQKGSAMWTYSRRTAGAWQKSYERHFAPRCRRCRISASRPPAAQFHTSSREKASPPIGRGSFLDARVRLESNLLRGANKLHEIFTQTHVQGSATVNYSPGESGRRVCVPQA